MMYEKELKRDIPKDSRLANILIITYMCTVLLFTAHDSLNIISLASFVIAFGYCGFYMLMHGRIIGFNKFTVLFAAFIVFCFFSLLWSKDFDTSVTSLITLVQLFVLSLVLCSYISHYENMDVFVFGLLISGLVCSYVVIGYYGVSEYFELMMQGVRLGGPIANENTIGLYAGTTVIVGFYYGFIKNKKLGYLAMILPLIVAFGTGSRKALIMIIVGILLLIFMRYRENISLASFAKLLACVIVILIVVKWLSTVPAFRTTFIRLESAFSEDVKDASASVRETMIDVGMRYFKKNPYTGVGLGNTNIITWQYLGWETYLHNNYVELLASVGIFGFLLYYSMYAYLLKNLYQISANTKDSISALMFVIVLTNLILEYGFVSYYNKMTHIYLAMAAATVVMGKKKMKEMESMIYEDDEEGFEGSEEPRIALEDGYR
ncbi:MAG: O-antigen ligase family protein [Clostridia bacterium]|nr:O-antigen ligase family protein [Clostridia bacterium]